MKIQDVELRTGLDRATIRFYEKEGLVIPSRLENGYRSYSENDVQLLLKIKLLRQLDVSLSKIKNLQQGRESFAAVLVRQIELLNQQIKSDTVAKQVCLTMQQDCAQYDTLNSAYYLEMLSSRHVVNKTEFNECVSIEHHPWRRFFARSIDNSLIAALLSFLIVVVFRIRPFSSNALQAIRYLSYIIAIPIMAFLQYLLGTTPGKWCMGIRLEHANGGKLRFSDAFYREIGVFSMGQGLQIPFISLWRLYKSYKNDVEGQGNSWNTDTEIIYTDWSVIKKALIGIISVAATVLSWFSSMDTMLPKYRGADITLAEFVQNYKDYEKTLDRVSEYSLSDDGLWIKIGQNYEVIIIDGDLEHERPDFIYRLTKDGHLRSIRYTDQWENAHFCNPVPAYCSTALYAILGSRPGVSYRDLVTAEELIISDINDQLVEKTKQGIFTGNFTVKDVKVSWVIIAKNCDAVTDFGRMVSFGDESLSYSIDLTIEVIE